MPDDRTTSFSSKSHEKEPQGPLSSSMAKEQLCPALGLSCGKGQLMAKTGSWD